MPTAAAGTASKYGAQNIRRFLTHVHAVSIAPPWVSALLTAMRVPTKNAVQVKKVIEEAIEVNKLLSTPKAVLQAMARSISPDIYKSFTARYTKDIALEALVDHLIDNPSDVVGLELGPGDEPLLPGTLLPMRGVRATDNPPPGFTGSGSGGGMAADGGGAGGGGSGAEEGGGSSLPLVAMESAGDTSGGAKSESMRRCRALVRYLATAPESMAFRRPVDTTVFTDYHNFVEDPCDLRTIDRRLEASEYGQSVVRFANDVRLVWRNGKRYNKEGSEVWAAADKLAKAFEVLLEKWVMGPWRAKRPKEDTKGKRKAEEEGSVPEELLAALNFADLEGPIPPWASGGKNWDPENGGLTERHIQALLTRVPWSEGCALCGRDDSPDKTLICDRCDREIHMFCLEPKLKKADHPSPGAAAAVPGVPGASGPRGRPMDLQSMYYKVQFGAFGGLHPDAVADLYPPEDTQDTPDGRTGSDPTGPLAAATGPAAAGMPVANGAVSDAGAVAAAAADTGSSPGDEAAIVDSFFSSVATGGEDISRADGVAGTRNPPPPASDGREGFGEGYRAGEDQEQGGVEVSVPATAVPFATATAPFDHVSFFRDMKLIWKNAQKFNHDGSPLWVAAEHFKQQLDRLYKERLLSVVQEKTPALPRQTMEDFLATQPPWEVLCGACGANADPEAKIKKTPTKKGKGSKKAAAAAAAAAAEEVWPALRCCVCRRPRHVECLLQPGQARDRAGRRRESTLLHQPMSPFPNQPHGPTHARLHRNDTGCGPARLGDSSPTPSMPLPPSAQARATTTEPGTAAPSLDNASRLSTPPSSPLKGPGAGGDLVGRNRSSSVGSGSRRTGRQRVAKSFGDEFDEVGCCLLGSGWMRAAGWELSPSMVALALARERRTNYPAALHSLCLMVRVSDKTRQAKASLSPDDTYREAFPNPISSPTLPYVPSGYVFPAPPVVTARTEVAGTARADGPGTGAGAPHDNREKQGHGVLDASAGLPVHGATNKAAVGSPRPGTPADLENGVVHFAEPLDGVNQGEGQPPATTQATPLAAKASGVAPPAPSSPAQPLPTGEKNEGLPGGVVEKPAAAVTATTEAAAEASESALPQAQPPHPAAGPPAQNGILSPPPRVPRRTEAAAAGAVGWQQSPTASPARAARESEANEADVPRIKVPRAELLGAVVARLAVRREMKHGEATVVREYVVTSFDEVEGRYVLVNAHNEEAKLTVEELEVALQQSQLLYGCAERMLPLSPSEIEKARAGELEASAVVAPPRGDATLAGTGAGGSGAGYGTSGDTLDSKSLGLASLLRSKSYAVFSPAERTRLLRGLCDLAVSTGPIKEHLQILQERVLRLETEAVASEKQASSMSERQRFEGDIGPSIKSPRRSQDFSCTHPERKHYARGLCVSCYQRWLRYRNMADEDAAAATGVPPLSGKKRPRTPTSGNGGKSAAASASQETPNRKGSSSARPPSSSGGQASRSPSPSEFPSTPSGAEEVDDDEAAPARRSKRARKEKSPFGESPVKPVPRRTGNNTGGGSTGGAAERARELRARGRKLSPVSRPLGVDRDGRVYVLFRGDPEAVYVGAPPGGSPGAAAEAGSKAAAKDKEGGDGEGDVEAERGRWSVFRGEAIEDLAKTLNSSPIRSEARLAKEMATQLNVSLETVPEGEEGDPTRCCVGRVLVSSHGSRNVGHPFNRRSEPSLPWNQQVDCSLRGAPTEQCQVSSRRWCLRDIADRRKRASAVAEGISDCFEPLSQNDTSFPRTAVGSGGGGSSSSKSGANHSSLEPKRLEAEGLVKEGKLDVAGLRGAVLQVAEAVPEKAWKTGQWRRVSYPAWRAFVLASTGPRELMQALLMMEAGIKKEWLAKWWTKGWSSPAVAMRIVTVQSVAFRSYALDSAVLYEGSAKGGTNRHAPPPPSGKKRGRPKSSPSSGPPKGARLFKGFHEVTCSKCGEGGALICCDYCPASFHMEPCLELTKDPAGPWACPLCRAGTPKAVNPKAAHAKGGKGAGGGGGRSSNAKKAS
ncbi:unnamed protein product [Scytosiphon promiscuus]